MTAQHDGGCQCGAVRYRFTGEASVLYACHCSICQTQSGSAFGLSLRLPAAHFHLLRGRLKSFDRQGNGQTVTGCFCPDCGTRMYHTLEKQPNVVSLKPGTLDETGWLPAPVHVWFDNAQPWVRLPADTKVFRTSASSSPAGEQDTGT